MASEFIMVLTKHRLFGLLLKPYLVEKLNNEFYTITESVLAEGVENMQLKQYENEIVKWSGQYSDKEIAKLFSRKKISPRDFLKSLTDDNLNSIREYIEKRLIKCFDIIQKNNVPVFYSVESRNLFDDDRLEIIKGTTHAVFNFIKEPGGSKYFLSISDGDNDIRLSNSPGEIITNSPCILMANQKIYFFSQSNDGIDGKKLLPFFTKDHIQIPKSAEKKYFETFVRNAVENYVVKAVGFVVDNSKPEPVPVLSLENDWKDEFTFILKFDYGGKYISPNYQKIAFVEFFENNGNYYYEKLERNIDFEQEKRAFLKTFNEIEELNNCSYKIKKELGNELNLLNWINSKSVLLSENEFVIKQNFHNRTYFTRSMTLRFQLMDQNDWFDLRGTVTFGEFTIPFVALKNHLLRDIKEFVLPNGEIAILPDEWFAKYAGLFKLNKTIDGGIKIKPYHLNYFYDELVRINKSLVEKMGSIDQLKPDKPVTLKAAFRPYQLTGFQWIYSLFTNQFGVCLADDMGLGKTLQTLAAILKIREKSHDKVKIQNSDLLLNNNNENKNIEDRIPAGLIVMPTSLLHNWVNEINKFAPQLRYYKHSGSNRARDINEFDNYDIVLTSYGVLRNDIELFRNYNFHFMIIDESQFIKNPGSKIYHSVMEIGAGYKMVLTGTPIENSLSDLWSQLNFINPGLLGSQDFFRKEFAEPIEKGKDGDIRLLKQQRLQKLINPFILRRTKQEVLDDLPDLTESVQYCEMHELQFKLYDEEKARIRNALLKCLDNKDIAQSNIIVLQGLTKLRQLANHPDLIENEGYTKGENSSGKFEEVIRMLESIMAENHKVLLFSSFVKHLGIFKDYFEQNNWKYALLTGSTNDREDQIKKFQEEADCQLFIISLKAGGVGLNLTAADYVFFLDPWWNPAAENQALSRAHRIGQKNKVMAYRFITEDSIEQKIMKLQEKKKELADIFINNNNPFKQLSQEEIVDLFN